MLLNLHFDECMESLGNAFESIESERKKQKETSKSKSKLEIDELVLTTLINQGFSLLDVGTMYIKRVIREVVALKIKGIEGVLDLGLIIQSMAKEYHVQEEQAKIQMHKALERVACKMGSPYTQCLFEFIMLTASTIYKKILDESPSEKSIIISSILKKVKEIDNIHSLNLIDKFLDIILSEE